VELPVFFTEACEMLITFKTSVFYGDGKKGLMGRIGRTSKSIQHIPNESQADLYSQLS